MLSGSSARIQWNEVNCLDANGLIEQYVVSYALSGGDGERLIRSTTSRMLVISELVAGQQYSVQVAAENSVGRGPFSDQISVILLGVYLTIIHRRWCHCSTCLHIMFIPQILRYVNLEMTTAILMQHASALLGASYVCVTAAIVEMV